MVGADVAAIRTIPESEATGPLAELYRRLADPNGRVANILKVQSLSPATLETHYAFYRALMFGAGPLSRAQRELLAVVTSATNHCHY
jgi:alkylhydroperoxidase family enzyme